VAINDVHLHIQDGEFTALVGPSGSGKTTLLNLIGGLDKPDEGNVVVDGVDITKLSPGKLIDFRLHNIGFVFQSFNLIPVLSARENVELIMQLQNINKADIRKRVVSLFRQIGLEDKMDARPAKLSGGQQQRVAVVRALASRPKFILADEPTANLDSKSASNLLDIMTVLNRDENMTFIFSTHDPRVIERARRVITLVDGQIFSDTAVVDVNVKHIAM
jgi:putative ABC transport system ATP-binding protein